jgi:hypothetical protein
LKRLGVPVETGTTVTEERVLEEKPDHVIVATGAVPIDRPLPEIVGPDMAIDIAPGAHVVSAWRVLSGEEQTGQRVLLYDVQPHLQGFATADFLSSQGKDVEMLVMGMRLAFSPFDVDAPTLAVHLMSLFLKEVKLTFFTAVKKAMPGRAVCYNPVSFAEREIECDTLVISYWRKADDRLYKALKGKVDSLIRIGDCVAPRAMLQAVYEGYVAANSLE